MGIFDFLQVPQQQQPASQPQAAPPTLFDLLRRATMAQQDSGQSPQPPQMNAYAATPQVASTQPTPAPSLATPPAASPGLGGHLMAGAQSLSSANGKLLPTLLNGLTGLVTGQRADPAGIAAQKAAQAQNVTAQALISKGVDPQIVAASVNNPDLMKTLISQTFGPQTVQTLGNGYIWDQKAGKAIQAYEPDNKKTFTSYKDAAGNEIPGSFDPSSGKFEPLAPTTAPAAPIPTNIEDLQKSDPAMASQVQAVLDGRTPYPAGSRLNPKQQQLKELVTQIDPTFDASTSRQRSKFNMEFGSTSPSTVGGQKILMQTALGHLGEVAESSARLNNSNGMGYAPVGHLYNYLGNQTTENAANANAHNDKVAKFSGEVGKLYSGSQGGGVHEREDTRARMGSDLTAAELASGLEASRDLIISKQKALEDQAVSIFGPDKAKRYDFIGQPGKQALDKIDESIRKLRGQSTAVQNQNAPAAVTAPAADPGALAEARRRGLIK